MAFSVNTNASALGALQQLTLTTRGLNETQERVNTGLEVRSAKDNAAVFAIAQNLRADFEGLQAVKQSIDRSISAIDIALAAAESLGDILLEMKERVVSAADEGLDQASRDSIRLDFEELRDQINIIVSNAEFNGTNLIDSGTDRVVAITNPDATQTITINHQDLTLGTGTSQGAILLFGAASTFSTSAQALSLVSSIDNSIANLSTALTELGAGASALERQRTFTERLSDTVETGIGNLVDADLARESAQLQSLQVKQQLGVQALSIANSQPQTILQLFGG